MYCIAVILSLITSIIKTEIMSVVNGDNLTAFRTVLHYSEELVDY